jgi:hypothetical protein
LVLPAASRPIEIKLRCCRMEIIMPIGGCCECFIAYEKVMDVRISLFPKSPEKTRDGEAQFRYLACVILLEVWDLRVETTR